MIEAKKELLIENLEKSTGCSTIVLCARRFLTCFQRMI